ncbi:MAG: UMP kinase [Elusimicrobia bacterium RIFOXYA2_FULL_39_19]|nr:MAG: UMP kinase [Elusimicrobia bacterium RIFOXYA2_FULL_39_19]
MTSKSSKTVKYKRVLLKLSGEILAGGKKFGFDSDVINQIAGEIQSVNDLGVELGVVIGGGNIWRGAEERIKGLDRVTADYMGMLATIIDSLALQSACEKRGIKTVVQSAIEITKLCEPYTTKSSINHMCNGKVVIFAGGTGNPYFTTDTTAALRSVELKADILLKATKVDGVYSDDPMKNPKATKYSEVSYMTAIEKKLRIMDMTAFSLCMDNNMKIMVFNLQKWGSVVKAIKGEKVGTLIY